MPGQVDSRVLRTTVGYGGVSKPVIFGDGKSQRGYCMNCGKPYGWGGTPGIGQTALIIICDDCTDRLGEPPLVRVPGT